MCEINKKIDELKNKEKYNDNLLCLIEPINNLSGFLYGSNKLYFAIKNNSSSKISITTTYLALKTNIYISGVENSSTFKAGHYDLVIYNMGIDDNYLESFVELCRMFVKYNSSVNFVNFFYSLLKLFEQPKETSYSNLVGSIGELLFIKKIFNDYSLNLTKYWHNTIGAFDKYDFACENLNLEVKTTIKENMIFTIKHSQIFNSSCNYIIVLNICADNSGISFADLYNYFKNNKPFCMDLNFALKLEQEKLKISPSDLTSKKFSLNKIQAFLNSDLETIQNIPSCISNLTYSYDFVDKKTTNLNTVIKKIKNS